MSATAAAGETKPGAMTLLTIPGKTPEEIEGYWLENVYQGDTVKQLTARAVVVGAVIGLFMCLSNLYVGLKTGWGLGVVITAVIISFAMYGLLARVAPGLFGANLTILENNAMASTASAAGYSTGATMVSATAAYLIVNGSHIAWPTLLLWTLFLSAMGVFMAVPMKRQMINVEQLKFPTGTAAAEVLRSLYATGDEARAKARALGIAGLVGALVAWARDGMGSIKAMADRHLALPAHTPFPGTLGGQPLDKWTISFENSLIMVGAGAIMGLRTTLSMLLGAFLCYGVLAPKMLELGAIDAKLGYRNIVSWSLWTGVSIMVVSSLLQFAFQGRTILRAFKGLGASLKGGGEADRMTAVEVPARWFGSGFLACTLGAVLVAYYGFDIPMHYSLLAVVLSFVLAIVACRATGETDTTPIGALGKITQLTYGVLIPQNMTANLMTASITGNTAAASADLLSDLKSGYLLGANPRKQFMAQLIGCIIGTAIIVPCFYLLVPTAETLGSDKFPAPAAQVWAGVAKLLSTGLEALHPTIRYGVAWGAVVGIVLPLLERFAPPKARPFVPSPMGIGLAFVIPAWNSLSMALGAVIAWAVDKKNQRAAERYTIAVASGFICGESLIGVAVALLAAAGVLG